jgi:hypothetical protein
VLRDAAGREGLGATLSNLGGVRELTFAVDYDPLLVNFENVQAGAGLPQDATVRFEFVDGAAGHRILRVVIESQTTLESGNVELVRLFGHARENYAGTEIIRIAVESINLETAGVVGDDAILVIANVNDADGDTVAMTAKDQTQLDRFRRSLQSGFEAWSLIDPSLLVADVKVEPPKVPLVTPTPPTPPPPPSVLSTPRVIEIPVIGSLFDELQAKLSALGVSVVQAGKGSVDSFEITAPWKLGMNQPFNPSGTPNGFDRPTGSFDANGGSGKIRFCRVTGVTFGWSFTVDEMLRALRFDPKIDLQIETPQTIPSSPAPGSAPPTEVPGKSGYIEQVLPRFASSGANISVAPERPAGGVLEKPARVVMDSDPAALAFLPAIIARKHLARRRSKGDLQHDRKAWRVDFVNPVDEGCDPNRDLSVRAASDGQKAFGLPPSI